MHSELVYFDKLVVEVHDIAAAAVVVVAAADDAEFVVAVVENLAVVAGGYLDCAVGEA